MGSGERAEEGTEEERWMSLAALVVPGCDRRDTSASDVFFADGNIQLSRPGMVGEV